MDVFAGVTIMAAATACSSRAHAGAAPASASIPGSAATSAPAAPMIPPAFGHGAAGQPPVITPNAALVRVVDLLQVR